MNLHLSGCTLGGGETLRRSVPRFFIFFLRRIALCVSERVVCAHTHTARAVVVAGLLPPHPSTSTFILWCHAAAGKRDMAHAGKNTRSDLSVFGRGGLMLRGWDRNSSAMPFDTHSWDRGSQTGEEHTSVERGESMSARTHGTHGWVFPRSLH